MFQKIAFMKNRGSVLLIALVSLSSGRVWENTSELYEIKLPTTEGLYTKDVSVSESFGIDILVLDRIVAIKL